ncbi:MAG: hypothetical protein IJQ30_02745, partial [Acidaminococcaceae bacterium]|nr:hypothetical protein [Acidaminococcaceae bacterium]
VSAKTVINFTCGKRNGKTAETRQATVVYGCKIPGQIRRKEDPVTVSWGWIIYRENEKIFTMPCQHPDSTLRYCRLQR